MRTYRGTRTIDGIRVTVDDRPLEQRVDLAVYSLNGFEWSYEGPEPSQLAFALILEHLGDGDRAKTLTEPFMRAMVATFDNDWVFTSADMADAIAALGAR